MPKTSTTATIADIERLRNMISDLEYELKKVNFRIANMERKITELEKKTYER